VKVTPLGDARYEVATESGRSVAYGIRRAGETWVFLDGRVYVIGPAGARAGAGRRDEASLAAPMPATVLAINVTAGQTVKAGDVLVILEAMKMELAVTAPHDGRVRALACHVGELVQPGIQLIELE
jgi:3-methylcrotonyl-CoA carboxylase alpha subunit